MHATTRLMANTIERCRGKFKSFLDVGTGTGILSLIALKSQAQNVDALDVDRHVFKTTRENFANNLLKARAFIKSDIKGFKTGRKYDFVAANLITHELIKAKRKLAALVKPGGYLAVCGITINNLETLKEGFQKLPLRCIKIQKAEGWVALLYKRI